MTSVLAEQPSIPATETAAPPSHARFWDRIAPRYAAKPVADEAAYQRKLLLTRQYLRPDMRVLEVGCGTGSTALELAPYVAEIVATDISDGMLAIAREKAAAAGVENVAFRQADADAIDRPAASVDAVLALSLLHLVSDRDRTLADLYRVLKPGGVLIANTACIGDTMGWFRLIAAPGRWLGLLPLVRVFGTRDLIVSLVAAGFAMEQQWQPAKGKVLFTIARKPI